MILEAIDGLPSSRSRSRQKREVLCSPPSETGLAGNVQPQPRAIHLLLRELLRHLGPYQALGINGGPIAPDLPFPMIAARDIADVAARVLQQRDWHGVVVRELLGERDLTFGEATRIIGERLRKPNLSYVRFPYADYTATLVQMGIAPNVAGLYAEMARAVNEGRVKSREGRRSDNTTPTRFEVFADTLAHTYQTV